MASRHSHAKSKAPELRIVLVGKTGVGKTSAMNTLLGNPSLTDTSACSDTTQCQSVRGEFNGQKLVLIDTPGIFNTKKSKEEVVREVVKCMICAAPGPHVFLYVMQPDTFTSEDYRAVEIIQRIFGKGFKDNTVVLFTCGDEIDGRIPPKILKSELIKGFNGRFHCFDNTETSPDQVIELLDKINELVRRNKGRFYSNEMFKQAQDVLAQELKKEAAMTPDTATDEVLNRVLSILLSLTVGGPMERLVTGAVKIVTEKSGECIAQ